VFKGFSETATSSPGHKVKTEVEASVEFFQNNQVRQLEVSNPEGYEIASATIFDMSGKLVLSESDLGNDTKLTFPTDNLSDGIYMVMLTTSENISINYKISVYNR
jgi:hypothetical protein